MSLASEALLAITGIYPKDPVSPDDAAAARRIPVEWQKRVAEFFEGKTQRPPMPRYPDYLKTWDLLNEDRDDAQLIVAIEDATIAAEYAGSIGSARAYVREQWRPLFQDIPTGRRVLEPSLSETQRAGAIFVFVDAPEAIFSEMLAGTIAADQVDAMKENYPALYDMLTVMCRSEIERRLARKQSYEVPWTQERVLRILLQLPLGQPIKPLEQGEKQAAPPKIDVEVGKSKDLPTKAQQISAQ